MSPPPESARLSCRIIRRGALSEASLSQVRGFLREKGDSPSPGKEFAWVDVGSGDEQTLLWLRDELGSLLPESPGQRGEQLHELDRRIGARLRVLQPIGEQAGDELKRNQPGDLFLLVTPTLVVTVRQDVPVLAEEQDLAAALRDGGSPDGAAPINRLLGQILHGLLRGHRELVDKLEGEVEELEGRVYAGRSSVSRDIYRLARACIDAERAIAPLQDVIDALEAQLGEWSGYRRLDVRTEHILNRVRRMHDLVTTAFTVNSALIAERQNAETARLNEISVQQSEVAKKISGWAAIFFAPTLVSGIYGMNFRYMPELHWLLGYPFALVLMVGGSAGLYAAFKKADWI